MELKTLVEGLNTKKNGAFFNMTYKTDLNKSLNAQSRKDGMSCYKIVEMTTRKMVDYDKQKSVQEKVENGKVLTHELPWGNWKEGFEGLIIEHKGNDYVRVYPGTNTPKVKYFLNDKEVTKDELKEAECMVNSFFKEKDSSDMPDAMTIRVDGVLEIK